MFPIVCISVDSYTVSPSQLVSNSKYVLVIITPPLLAYLKFFNGNTQFHSDTDTVSDSNTNSNSNTNSYTY